MKQQERKNADNYNAESSFNPPHLSARKKKHIIFSLPECHSTMRRPRKAATAAAMRKKELRRSETRATGRRAAGNGTPAFFRKVSEAYEA